MSIQSNMLSSAATPPRAAALVCNPNASSSVPRHQLTTNSGMIPYSSSHISDGSRTSIEKNASDAGRVKTRGSTARITSLPVPLQPLPQQRQQQQPQPQQLLQQQPQPHPQTQPAAPLMPTSGQGCNEYQHHAQRPLRNYPGSPRIVPLEPADSLLSTMPANAGSIDLAPARSIDLAPTLLTDGRVLSRIASSGPVKAAACADKLPRERRWETQKVLDLQKNPKTIHGIGCLSGPQAQQELWRLNAGCRESLLEQQLEQRLEQRLEKWLDTRLKHELQALRADLAGETLLRDAICHQKMQDDARLHDATAANLEARLCSLATAVEKVSTDFQKLVDVVFTELRLQAKQGSEDVGSSYVATPLSQTQQLPSWQTPLLGHNGVQLEQNGGCRSIAAASNMATAAMTSSTTSTASVCSASAPAGGGSGGSHNIVADSNVLSTLPESTTEEHLVHIEEQLVRLDGAINCEARLRRDFEQRWATEMQSKLREVGSAPGEELKRPQQLQLEPQQLQLPFQHAG